MMQTRSVYTQSHFFFRIVPSGRTMYDSRRTSYSSSRSASTVSNTSLTSEPDIRKTSLKEMPSYRVEASKALNRRDDLVDLHRRLSSNRDLLNADPATKPWLKFRSISQTGTQQCRPILLLCKQRCQKTKIVQFASKVQISTFFYKYFP